MTAGEDAVFRALLDEDTTSRLAIVATTGFGQRSVDVLITRMRRKVSAHGVEIENVRGKGWRLVGRETWRRALAAFNGE